MYAWGYNPDRTPSIGEDNISALRHKNRRLDAYIRREVTAGVQIRLVQKLDMESFYGDFSEDVGKRSSYIQNKNLECKFVSVLFCRRRRL